MGEGGGGYFIQKLELLKCKYALRKKLCIKKVCAKVGFVPKSTVDSVKCILAVFFNQGRRFLESAPRQRK